MINRHCKTITAALVASVFCATAVGFAVAPDVGTSQNAPDQNTIDHKKLPTAKAPLDRTGKKRTGKASVYAKRFSGRKMADGNIMEPRDNSAASKTLPLGTIAKVTNLENGKSAVVTIEDRGPYVGGRIVDLSPATADKLGISKQQGVAKVAVAPIAVPLPDGAVKLGSGAAEH
jgi:rare lipoprotein A